MTDSRDLSPSGAFPLDEQACFERLVRTSIGRVTLSLDALPEIFPVQYALLGRDPVFRAVPGHKLTGAAHGQILSMGIDDYDAEVQFGWHVLVTGPAARLTEPRDLEAANALPLTPWTTRDDEFVRISAALVRGIEIRERPAPGAPGA